MKPQYLLRFISSIVMIALASSCTAGNVRPSPKLLYVASLPDLSHTIVVLDPDKPNRSGNIYLDSVIKSVEMVTWSPKRDQIIYVTSISQLLQESLWIMNPDGSSRREILPSGPFGLESARMSPDQRYIAFRQNESKDPAQWAINLVDIKQGTTQELMVGVWAFAVAPANDLIAISRWQPNDSALYIVWQDGKIQAKYSDVALDAPNNSLTWSPDGKQLAFASSYSLADGRSHPSDIYVIDIASGSKKQLTSSDAQYMDRLIGGLSWSPDGKRILFTSNFTRQNGEGDIDVLFIVDVNTGHETRLADHIQWSQPVWSPDGKRIAFISTMDGSNYGQIYTIDVTSGEIVQLTHDNEVFKKSLSW